MCPFDVTQDLNKICAPNIIRIWSGLTTLVITLAYIQGIKFLKWLKAANKDNKNCLKP